MLRSFYIAGTGMLAQRARMNVLTNNITNIDTTGYKKDAIVSRSFADLLIQNKKDPYLLNKSALIGPQNTGAHVDIIATVFSQGDLEETRRQTDLALEGQGFFTVQTNEGNRYTRDGSFSVGNDGCLITGDGCYVSGYNGRIYVGHGSFAVDTLGNVTVDGQITDRLRIVDFDDLSGLRKTGENLYANYSNQPVRQAQNVKVMQGYLEVSNVNMADEVVNMVEVNRAFEMNQRVLRIIDESLSKSVNEVGRV